MARQKLNQGTFPTGAGGDNWRTGSAKLDDGIGELYNQFGANNQGVLPSALPINKGGTEATTAANARTNLDVFSKSEVTKAIEAINMPEVPDASTSTKGVVQLANALNDTSVVKALTAAMGKKLQDDKLNTSEVGTSGNKIPRLNTSNNWGGTQNYSYRIRLARPGIPYMTLCDTTATETGAASFGRILFGYGDTETDWGITKVSSFINAGRTANGVEFLSLVVGSHVMSIHSDGSGNYSGNASSASKLEFLGNETLAPETGGEASRYSVRGAYFSGIFGGGALGYPINYGNRFTLKGHNLSATEIIHEWQSGNNDRLFVRSRGDRDPQQWSSYSEIAFTNSNITGNAATATKLETARKVNGVDFDGSKDITIPMSPTYSLPTASATVKGGIKVGTGLSIAAESLSVQFASQTEANAGIDDAKAITSKKMNEAVKNQLNATGSAPTFACRAWVNFEGGATPTMRANGNILGVSRASTGVYTVRFLTPIYSDYSVVHGLNVSSTGKAGGALSISNMTSSGFDVSIWNNTWNPVDPFMASFGVFSK